MGFSADWSAVRVWWPPSHAWGVTVYPTYGFIQPRPAGLQNAPIAQMGVRGTDHESYYFDAPQARSGGKGQRERKARQEAAHSHRSASRRPSG